MRIPDRFWWAERAVGMLAAAAGVGVGLAVWIFWDLIWNFPIMPGDPVLIKLRDEETLLGCSAVLIALQGLLLIGKSLAPHNRFQRRLAAIRGQQDAVPQARIKEDPSAAPGRLTEPIELIWRATSLGRRLYTTIFAIVCIVFGALAVLFVYILYIGVATQPTKPISLLEYAVAGAICVFCVGICMAPIVLFAVLLPAKRGRPYGVFTSDEGITSHPQVGGRRFIRWEDMRLLEVANSSFSLYGRDKIIQWYNTGPNNMVETGTTDEEFSRRHQMLLSMIAARAGLTPRTFTKSLQRGPEDGPEQTRWEVEKAEEVRGENS